MQQELSAPNRLRELREAAGLTQAALAGSVGVTKQAISQFETGNLQPSLAIALAIARALGSTVDDVFVPARSTEAVDDSISRDRSAKAEAPAK